MNAQVLFVVLGVLAVVGLIGTLFVSFQLRDRLDKIAELLEKK
jgi:hypothetical protein